MKGLVAADFVQNINKGHKQRIYCRDAVSDGVSLSICGTTPILKRVTSKTTRPKGCPVSQVKPGGVSDVIGCLLI